MTIHAQPARIVERPEFSLPGADHFVRIPDGEYTADFIGSECFFYRGHPAAPRITLWFRIRGDFGSENRIARYYRVRKLFRGDTALHPSDLKGTRLRVYQFEAGWRSDVVNELARLFPDRYAPDELPNRIPDINSPLHIRVTTVSADHHGIARAECFRSSKVEKIIGWSAAYSYGADSSVDNTIDIDRYADLYPYRSSIGDTSNPSEGRTVDYWDGISE